MEGSVDGERGHIFLQVELVRHVGTVEDEVEGKGPGFGPVFGASVDEFFGAKGFGIFFFGGGVGEGIDFGAQGGGPEDAKVAETATISCINRELTFPE